MKLWIDLLLFIFLNESPALDRMLILASQMSMFWVKQKSTNHVYELLRCYGSLAKGPSSFAASFTEVVPWLNPDFNHWLGMLEEKIRQNIWESSYKPKIISLWISTSADTKLMYPQLTVVKQINEIYRSHEATKHIITCSLSKACSPSLNTQTGTASEHDISRWWLLFQPDMRHVDGSASSCG